MAELSINDDTDGFFSSSRDLGQSYGNLDMSRKSVKDMSREELLGVISGNASVLTSVNPTPNLSMSDVIPIGMGSNLNRSNAWDSKIAGTAIMSL